jgi:hypothetical protein
MDDAAFMGVLEGFADLFGDRQGFIGRDWAGLNAIGEGRSFDKFHNQSVGSGGIFETIDGRDVGVIEGGEKFGFAAETGEAIVVDGDRSGENLQGYLAAEFAVEGAVDFAHSADAEQGIHFMDANFRTGCEGHGMCEL